MIKILLLFSADRRAFNTLLPLAATHPVERSHPKSEEKKDGNRQFRGSLNTF